MTDLENEDDMQLKRIRTSTLQQWHRKGRGDCINPQPVMEVLVTKTSLELDKQSSSRGSGLKCLLYEARNSLKGQQASESKSLERLRELNPKMALSHIMTARTESHTFPDKIWKKSSRILCQLPAIRDYTASDFLRSRLKCK